MSLMIATIAERPDLAPLLDGFDGAWPEFMLNDPVSSLYYADNVEAHPEFALIAVDSGAPDRPVAKAYSVPFSTAADPDAGLPGGGWDWVVRRATHDRLAGHRPNLVSALEITIHPERRGGGLSAVMLDAMRRNAARLGFTSLVAPLRPSGKHAHPEVPMSEYAGWTRDDGLPVDPWLRVHVRAGGRIVNVAPCSMTIPGTLSQWRAWTGLSFDSTGPVIVPQALNPVHCDVAEDHAVYVEPNVWVHHRLG